MCIRDRSIGIYSYELFNFYEAETIIRIGTAGALVPQVQPRDVIIAQGACHDTNVDRQYGLPGTYAPIADFGLVKRAYELATEKNIKAHVGNAVSYTHLDVYKRQVYRGYKQILLRKLYN